MADQKSVTLSGGTLEYLERGEGTPLLLVHGVLVNSSNWDRVFGPLSEHHRCIAPTLPLGAHRFPFDTSADLTPAGIADVLREFMDALGLERAALVGNDTGGAYAQVFAAHYPDRVSRLVLSSCDALDTFPPPQFSALKKFIDVPLFTCGLALAFRFKPLLTSRWVLGLLSSRLTNEEVYEKYLKHFITDEAVRNDFKKVVRSLSTRYTQAAALTLSRQNRPTLLLWAAQDKLFPVALAQRLHQMLPDSQLVLVDDSLTYVQVDQPALFAEHVLAFTDRHLIKRDPGIQVAC